MKLYHVSYLPIEQFTLRVPTHKLPDEDNQTKRICCSTTIENCIMAKPGKADFLLLCVEHELPCVLYVYSFDVDEKDPDIVTPKELVRKGKVSDAVENQEYWICNKIPAWEEQVCKVTSVFRFGNFVSQLVVSMKLQDSDFLFVNTVQAYEKQTGKHLCPDEVFPQIWDKMMESFHKKVQTKIFTYPIG